MSFLRKRFSERNPVLLGVIVSAILVVALAVSLDVEHLPFLDSGRHYDAMFTESGGLGSGDDVQVAGLKVGTVSSVTLDGNRVKVAFAVTDHGVRLGSRTGATISTLTLLGKRGLTLTSAGPGTLAPGSTIPTGRTTPPYDLTDALSQLTTTTASIDTASFAKALRTLTTTFKDTPASVHSTVRAVSRISQTIASRDDEVGSLFAASNNVSHVLASRDAQITTLLGDGTRLLAVINARRDAVSSLLVHATELAHQLNGLVADNKKDFGPAFDELSKAVNLLNANKAALDKTLDQAGPFAGSLGESVSSGPFFQSYVQNLLRPVELTGNN